MMSEEKHFYSGDVEVVCGPVRRSMEKFGAVLMCEGKCDRPTPHLFYGRRLISFRTGAPLYDEVIYSCRKCDRRRIWGAEVVDQLEQ